MTDKKIIVGISHGDINGVSYEMILKTFRDNRILELCTPIVYGSPKVAAYHRKALNINNFSFNAINSADLLNHKKANLISCIDDNIRVELGKSTPMAGEAAVISFETAVKDLEDGKIDVLVTAPINSENTQTESLNFKGHTQYLKDKFNSNNGFTLMTNSLMKVAVVSGNVPLKEAGEYVTEDNILNKLRLLNKTLIEDFAIRGPKIAVLSLNPSASGKNSIGKEEAEIIIPAIEKAKKEGIVALGPFSSDVLFGSDKFSKFDAILAMYHDQGITPFKALSHGFPVNYTAGLPIIRTSPDSETDYENAGLDKTSVSSFREAIYMACEIYKNRISHAELTANPLKKHKTSDR